MDVWFFDTSKVGFSSSTVSILTNTNTKINQSLGRNFEFVIENFNMKYGDIEFRYFHMKIISLNLNKLDIRKACQRNNIVTKISRNTSHKFADVFPLSCHNLKCLSLLVFSVKLNNADARLVY